jgi:translation initiation factor IF-3
MRLLLGAILFSILIVWAKGLIVVSAWTPIRPIKASSSSSLLLRMARQKPSNFDRRIKKKIEPINDYIKFPQVRLLMIGETPGEDEMVGIVPLEEARERAAEEGLDLVLINDKADPPVCKIIDYGKYRYAQEKKKKENAKKQTKVDIKEVKMSYKIEDHDFNVRLKNVQRFIAAGDKVKVVVQFKGREMQYKDLGKELLFKIFQPLEEIVVMESPPKIEGRAVAMMLGPKKIT